MFKFLPATEKEFDLEQARQSTPGFVRTLLIAFVFVIILGAVWFDWAHAAGTDNPVGIKLVQYVDFNLRLKESMDRGNEIAMKHFGFKVYNSLKAEAGAIHMDMNRKTFDNSKLSVDKQLDVFVDNLTYGNISGLKQMGISGIIILIDGVEYKKYTF